MAESDVALNKYQQFAVDLLSQVLKHMTISRPLVDILRNKVNVGDPGGRINVPSLFIERLTDDRFTVKLSYDERVDNVSAQRMNTDPLNISTDVLIDETGGLRVVPSVTWTEIIVLPETVEQTPGS